MSKQSKEQFEFDLFVISVLKKIKTFKAFITLFQLIVLWLIYAAMHKFCAFFFFGARMNI